MFKRSFNSFDLLFDQLEKFEEKKDVRNSKNLKTVRTLCSFRL